MKNRSQKVNFLSSTESQYSIFSPKLDVNLKHLMRKYLNEKFFLQLQMRLKKCFLYQWRCSVVLNVSVLIQWTIWIELMLTVSRTFYSSHNSSICWHFSCEPTAYLIKIFQLINKIIDTKVWFFFHLTSKLDKIIVIKESKCC